MAWTSRTGLSSTASTSGSWRQAFRRDFCFVRLVLGQSFFGKYVDALISKVLKSSSFSKLWGPLRRFLFTWCEKDLPERKTKALLLWFRKSDGFLPNQTSCDMAPLIKLIEESVQKWPARRGQSSPLAIDQDWALPWCPDGRHNLQDGHMGCIHKQYQTIWLCCIQHHVL